MTALEGVKSAADTTKQFITLATGVLTITITFSDKFGGGVGKIPLGVAWLAFMVVIIRGTATLMEITRAIHRAEKGLSIDDGNPPPDEGKTVVADPYHRRISKPAKDMVIAFWTGMAAVLVAGFIIMASPAKSAAKPAAETPTSHCPIDRSRAVEAPSPR